MAKSTKPDEPKSPSDDGKVEDQLSGIEPEAAEPGTEESTDTTEDEYVPEESAALEDEAADESGNENPWDDADDGEDAYDGDRDVYDDDEDEAEEYRAAETAHAPAADYAPEESASIWPAVLGGVIAAVIGFLLGRAEVLDNYLPAGLQRPSVDLSEIQTALQRLADVTAAQKARIDSLEAADASPDLEAVQTSVSSLESSQAELRSRLEAVEARPVAVEPVDDGKQDQALSELQQTLATQRQEIDRLAGEIDSAKADAQSEAQRTLARANL